MKKLTLTVLLFIGVVTGSLSSCSTQQYVPKTTEQLEREYYRESINAINKAKYNDYIYKINRHSLKFNGR